MDELIEKKDWLPEIQRYFAAGNSLAPEAAAAGGAAAGTGAGLAGAGLGAAEGAAALAPEVASMGVAEATAMPIAAEGLSPGVGNIGVAEATALPGVEAFPQPVRLSEATMLPGAVSPVHEPVPSLASRDGHNAGQSMTKAPGTPHEPAMSPKNVQDLADFMGAVADFGNALFEQPAQALPAFKRNPPAPRWEPWPRKPYKLPETRLVPDNEYEWLRMMRGY